MVDEEKYILVDIMNHLVSLEVYTKGKAGSKKILAAFNENEVELFKDHKVQYFKDIQQKIFEELIAAHERFYGDFIGKPTMPYKVTDDTYAAGIMYVDNISRKIERLHEMPYIIWACANH